MGLPELLRDETLLWYRNNRASWITWEEFSREFRQQYLPRRYRGQMVREIQGRMQRPDEPFHKYATAMLMNMRRAGGFSQEDQIDCTRTCIWSTNCTYASMTFPASAN